MLGCVAKIKRNYPGAQGAVLNDSDEIRTFLIQPQLKKTPPLLRDVLSLARQSAIAGSPCRHLPTVLSDYNSALCKRRNAVGVECTSTRRLEKVQKGLYKRTKPNRDENSRLFNRFRAQIFGQEWEGGGGGQAPSNTKKYKCKVSPQANATGSFELER